MTGRAVNVKVTWFVSGCGLGVDTVSKTRIEGISLDGECIGV